VTDERNDRDLDWEQLGRAIEAARGRQDLTQQQLADLVEVTVKTINTLENGRGTGMRAGTRARLEAALGWPSGEVHRILKGQAMTAVAPQLSVVPETVEPAVEDNEVLAAIHRDPYLLPEAKEHFLNQYRLLRKINTPTDERLPYAAHGQRTTPVDPEEEARIEQVARDAHHANPKAPGRKPSTGQVSPKGQK
jgi:DNA-binding XRE family transcriptional regulator